MIHDINYDKVMEQFRTYWARENKDKPLLHIIGKKDNYIGKEITEPDTLEQRWLDIDYLIESKRENIKSTYYGGVAYPSVMPDVGPDLFGTLLGCDIEFGEDTSWAHTCVDDFSTYPEFKFDQNSKWWKKIIELTSAFVEDGKNGDYLVGVADMHPGLDGLVSIRGPENLCMDLYDCPEEIHRRLKSTFPIYKESMDILFKLTTKYQKYNCHWLNPLNDKRWYNVSCDFMCMLSSEMFEEFVFQEIVDEIALYDKTLFHLDGPGALKHLDRLLEIKDLTGIQWVYGAGATTAKDWIDTLKKIQNAGKCVHVNIEPQDVDSILENIKPEGLMLNAYCKTEDEAKQIENKINSFYKKVIF